MLSAFLAPACVDKDTFVTGVSLDHSEITIYVGQRVDLTATITPENAAEQTMYWYSSSPEYATVDENGRVTGVGVYESRWDKCDIIVTTKEGRFIDGCLVLVDITPDIEVFPSTINAVAGSITGSLNLRNAGTFPNHFRYQWFINTANNNTGGNAISGATSASLQLPASLGVGTHYIYCRVNISHFNTAFYVRSNVARVEVR